VAYWEFYSAIPGDVWPAVPAPAAAMALALQFQLEQIERLPAARLRELQFRQLAALVQHAYATVPYYRERWRSTYDPAQALTPERFAALPLLSRREVQEQFAALASREAPAAHGPVREARTSGSTGMPVRVLKTGLADLLWTACVLRDHRWHRRDLRGKLAAIRRGVTTGAGHGWGPATDGVTATGPAVTLGVEADVDSQLRWLAQEQPDFLLTYPSNVAELAKSELARGGPRLRLREVRTFGEVLPPETRELCRRAWGAQVTDAYSAEEVGYMALQCPQNEHYHVMSENVLLEVLDARGMPCAPSGVGRVVVTALHSFAMPLIRYEIGDYAEAGEPCSCGSGLPVLRRILGRARNMLVTAGGERYWPGFGTRAFGEIAPVLQHQFVQKSFDLIEARLVTGRALSAREEEQLERHMLSRLPPGFRIGFVYCDEIPRSPGGKFEDFICELAVPIAAPAARAPVTDGAP